MIFKIDTCQSNGMVIAQNLNKILPHVATLGILEYLSQSNNNADFVSERFKFIDDLTILEIVDLLSIGLSSYKVKHQVPSDIINSNQFISPDNLDS